MGGMIKNVILIVLSLFCLNCGYHLRGTGSSLPPHVKSVNIPMFKNMTTRFQLDLKMTQGVIDEMVARGKVEITSQKDAADAILIGEISSFTVRPIAFSGEAAADRYNIIVVAKIVLRDLIDKKVLFSNNNFIYQEEYEVPEGTDFESVQSEAIDKIAEKFARSVVITILEGF